MSQREPKDLNADELISCARIVKRFTHYRTIGIVGGQVECVFCQQTGVFDQSGVRVTHGFSCPYVLAVSLFGAIE